jgi:hypothetical protein
MGGDRPATSSVAALIDWVKVAKSVAVTRGLSPSLPNDLVTATAI